MSSISLGDIMPWKVDWKVEIEGEDRSETMGKYLISIEVEEGEGSEADKASLCFDDTAGQLKLPKKGQKVRIWLNDVEVFSGVLDDPEWSIARGSGRQLTVSAKGFDSRSKIKEPLNFHMDNATLKEFLTEAGKRADIDEIVIDPAFADIWRDFWSADDESFLHLGNRLAPEVGGTFKVKNRKAALAKRGGGKTPGGADMPVILVDCAKTTTTLRVKPGVGRSDYSSTRIRYFDRKEAKWKEEDIEIKTGEDAPKARDVVRFPKADREQAKLVGKGRKAAADRERGSGSATIDLDPTARVEGTARVVNAREGIDGDYRIRTAKHRANRSGGGTTDITIGEPGEGVGKDERKAEGDSEVKG